MHAPDRPRVGYVVKRYPRFSETFVVNEILALEQAGVDVEIFALGGPVDTHFQEAIARVRAPVTYLAADGVRFADGWSRLRQAVDELPRAWPVLSASPVAAGREALQAAMLARHVVRRGIGHLHAHFASTPASVAALAAQMAGIAYSLTAHAKDIYGPEVSHDDLARKLAGAAATITVSDYNRAHLKRTFGSAADRVVRVYNGLPLEEFPYSSPADRPPAIVGVGRLVEKKGFADLLDACALLAGAGTEFTCRIIGAGELGPALDAQVARLGLEPQVELLGARSRAEVVRCLQEAAVMALPCVVSPGGDRDGLPTVLLEAMALGTPCVSTRVTGIPEIIEPGVTGLLAGERRPSELAAALERLLRDPSLRVAIAGRARAQIERLFDARVNAAQIRAIFEAALAAAPAGVR